MANGWMNFLRRRWWLAGLPVVGILLCLRPLPTNPSSGPVLGGLHPPQEVATIFERSCVDCHTNHTRWPWYAHFAPVRLMIQRDVERGRSIFNLSEWEQSSKGKRLGFMASLASSAAAHRMPPAQYTLLHPYSLLSPADRIALGSWAKAEYRRIRKEPAASEVTQAR